MSLRIVVDDQVERAAEAFSGPGVDLVSLESARIDRAAVRDACALIVRSTLRVDADLVADTSVRFVGSATVGVDHVDREALLRAGVAFAAAPGSSAPSVTQFTLAAIVLACDRLGRDWTTARLAVVGCGAIGERVAKAAEHLGLTVLRHDPPRAASEGCARFVSRERLAEADVVTLHVPLTHAGPHATAAMIDDDYIACLAPDALLVNTARGRIIDSRAVLRALDDGRLGGAVLDVFPREPDCDAELVAAATLATPHIAGRSEEALVANTASVRRAMEEALGLALAPWKPAFDGAGVLEGGSVADALRAAWDLEALDASLRSSDDRAATFKELRRILPRRRDLTSFRVANDADDVVRRFHEALPTR